jgi:hypothetical protein
MANHKIAKLQTNGDSVQAYEFIAPDWVPLGNPYSLTAVSFPALAAMSETRLAEIDATNDKLQALDFDGTDWALAGNQLSLLNAGRLSLAVIAADTVALASVTTSNLQAYSFDETNWTPTGNPYSLAGLGTCIVVAIGNNQVALTNSTGTQVLLTLAFDGTDWAPVGNSLAIGFSLMGGTMLDTDLIARINGTGIGAVIARNAFDGTDWSTPGVGGAGGSNDGVIAGLSPTEIVIANSSTNNFTMRLLQWDGADWVQVGNPLTNNNSGISSVTALTWIPQISPTPAPTTQLFSDRKLVKLRNYTWPKDRIYHPRLSRTFITRGE